MTSVLLLNEQISSYQGALFHAASKALANQLGPPATVLEWTRSEPFQEGKRFSWLLVLKPPALPGAHSAGNHSFLFLLRVCVVRETALSTAQYVPQEAQDNTTPTKVTGRLLLV